MNWDAITLEDCIIHYEVNNYATIINDGHVLKFMEEQQQQPLLTPYTLEL